MNTTDGSKTSQDLIKQLRIKSVRQSKVRIVEDKHASGHYQIKTVSDDEGAKSGESSPNRQYNTQQAATRPLLPKDKVISNATNLHRAADTGQTRKNWMSNDPLRESAEFINMSPQSREPQQNEFPDNQCV